MSFVQLDNGDFPPLDKVSQSQKVVKTKTIREKQQGNNYLISNNQDKTNTMREQKQEHSLGSSDFVKCRVGLKVNDYTENLEHLLEDYRIGTFGDFILTQITQTRSSNDDKEFNAISDLVLHGDIWTTRVALSLSHPSMEYYQPDEVKHFDQLFRHALYLPSPVIVISCPDKTLTHLSVASTVNDRLSETKSKQPLVLFKIPVNRYENEQDCISAWQAAGVTGSPMKTTNLKKSPTKSKDSNSQTTSADSDSNNSATSFSGDTGFEDLYSNNGGDVRRSSWNQWNDLRSHLIPDRRIGVCLEINEEFIENDTDLKKWQGETVRMFIIHTDQFVRTPDHGTLRLNIRCKEFIKKVSLANSLKTSFVVNGIEGEDLREYLICLDYFTNDLMTKNQDYLRDWNDKLQPPLQPLSSNLCSCTYGVFEMDSMKYIKYQEAMKEALQHLIENEKRNRKFILMVLGAGRGPLVDSFIEAIKSLGTKNRFKIYALDKNPSSVRALRHKQKYTWPDSSGVYETEVIEADMRNWRSNVKADIVATELLGSLSDNELSPECIDGIWKLATPSTISIPQSYTSYIAPICSYKLHQELHCNAMIESNVFDQIYVVRLSNYYHISEPQPLFKFEHEDLSKNPNSRSNERYAKLVFFSKVDTICHGFSGYFTAKLFGSASLSTLYGNKTPGMDSWFPAFIPLQEPIQMPKHTKLEVHFWRKESNTSVWYQWVVTSPVKSRFYSPQGVSTAMSKFI